MRERTRKIINYILENYKDYKIVDVCMSDFNIAFYYSLEQILKKEIGDTISGDTFKKYVNLEYVDLGGVDEYGEDYYDGYWKIGELKK